MVYVKWTVAHCADVSGYAVQYPSRTVLCYIVYHSVQFTQCQAQQCRAMPAASGKISSDLCHL